MALTTEEHQMLNDAKTACVNAASKVEEVLDIIHDVNDVGADAVDIATHNTDEEAHEPLTILIRDKFRAEIEASTGGKNTVIYDDLGNPNVMVVVPAFNLQDVATDTDGTSLGTGLHPAFMRNDGDTIKEIFVSKFLASKVGTGTTERAVSQGHKKPWTYTTLDNAVAACRKSGAGWHLMTTAEWAAIALWCIKNNFQPRGNNSYGRDYIYKHETGVLYGTSNAPGDTANGPMAATLTGSGPNSWNHDNSPYGIADLNGNVSEWTSGYRLVDGEIQIIPKNDASVDLADLSADSSLWRAVLSDGTLVTSGTTGTLKFDATGEGGSGSPILSTTVESPSDGSTSASAYFKDITAKEGVTIPSLLKSLAIFPADIAQGEIGRFYMRNEGECCPYRGGNWYNTSHAGLFSANCTNPRSYSYSYLGFRSAFIPAAL